jgi:tetratricopeptide (TPR) repeat protein
MHRLLTVLTVLFSLSSIPSAVRQYRMFLDAYDRQQKGDARGARQSYATLLARHPDSFLLREAQFNLAGTEYSLNRYREASAIYAGLQPVKGAIGVNASYNRGNALATVAFANPKAHDYQEQLRSSLACYRRALLVDPRDIDARINYEIVLRALRSLAPPPSSSAGGGGKGSPGNQPQQQALSSDVSNLVLGNARQEEGQMMRKYFRPAPPRQNPKEQKDW